MDIINEFDFAIYPRKLWIAVSKSKFEDTFEELCEFDENCDAQVNNVFNFKTQKGGILIRFENKEAMTTGNIAHEASHVAMEVFDFIGAEVDVNNQECFSYLIGYIAKCCEEVKNK